MAFDIALSGLNAAQTDLDVIANNVANSNTTGFKKSRAEFADVYALTQFGVANDASGKGVRVANVRTMHTQGDINFTESNLDLAISGQGFFRLNDAGSTVFSRAGRTCTRLVSSKRPTIDRPCHQPEPARTERQANQLYRRVRDRCCRSPGGRRGGALADRQRGSRIVCFGSPRRGS